MDVGIIVQPSRSALSKTALSETNGPVFLKCGCVLSVSEAKKVANDAGFAFCPVCEYSWAEKSKEAMVEAKELTAAHIVAQERRCTFFEGEVARLEQAMDHWKLREDVALAEGEDKLAWIPESDPSSVSDGSDMEVGDFLAFDSTLYALYQGRLAKLLAHRDRLLAKKKESLAAGAAKGYPWATDASWAFPDDTNEFQDVQARAGRRATRRAERKLRYAARLARRGAAKVVHNVHVLDKNVPRKWRDSNPNGLPPTDFEEKAREKQGWLTEQEQEDMDDDEQAATIEKRREEWRSKQSKVPRVFDSVKRQRWANRLYAISRRRHYFGERMQEITDEAEKARWQALLDLHEARLADTRAKCAERVAELDAVARYAAAEALQRTLEEAEDIGKREIEDEIEMQRLAAEEEARRLAAEEEARAKAEAKAKAKAEAEARGETYVDPDAAEDNEGDDEDEE